MAARLAGLKRNFSIAATSLTCIMRLPLLDRSVDWAAGGRFSVGVWAGAGLWTVDTVWEKVGAGVGVGILSVVQKEWGGLGWEN